MTLAIEPLVDYQAIAADLIQEFAQTAVERDAQGGTPQQERDRLRQSGLLKLVIPKQYGGLGASWVATLQLMREFAKIDSSIAHIFSYHHLGTVTPHIFGTLEQRERYYTQTALNNWFWCNAFNPLDRRVTLTPEADSFQGGEAKRFRLNGTKSFCSGSVDSNLIPVTAVYEGASGLTIAIVPTQREGIIVHGDWDNIGQRQTDSGSITFNNVLVERDEILFPDAQGSAFKTIRACLTQANLTNIYLGIAIGALEAAKEYTTTQSRAWITSGVEKTTQDPYILHHYGELWTNLQAGLALADRANEQVQAIWERGEQLTPEERGECAITIAAAKSFVTKAGLEVTSKIFELMGTRSTAYQYRFDRYWRNLRVFTLHDPVDYKLRTVGNWVLTGELPKPDSYS
ncbi:MAG: acyl-CoA dehydrogenase family protein [Elainellaceae cyanobacterium]